MKEKWDLKSEKLSSTRRLIATEKQQWRDICYFVIVEGTLLFDKNIAFIRNKNPVAVNKDENNSSFLRYKIIFLNFILSKVITKRK